MGFDISRLRRSDQIVGGSAIALFIFFRKDWVRIIRGFFRSLRHRRVETKDERLAWLLVVAFFRLHGSGKQQEVLEVAGPRSKLRFFAMTYALKNLYQGMLFFLLPFYWKSATLSSYNVAFLTVIAVFILRDINRRGNEA